MNHRQQTQGTSKKGCSKTLQKHFKSVDIYGETLSLTYKGETAYKTRIGATTTLIVISAIVAYSVYRCFVLLTRQDPARNKASLQKNLNITDEYFPSDYGFDFAFGFRFGELDPTLAYLILNEVEFYYDTENPGEDGSVERVKKKTPIPYDLCQNGEFKFFDQESVELYGINNLYCTKSKNYSVQGDFYSNTFKYIEVKLYKCRGEHCQNESAIDEFFTDQALSFAFVNSYFDFDDYVDPIKYFIDDSLFWELEKDRTKMSNFYIKLNEAELQDDLYQLGQKDSINFQNVERVREYDNNYNEGKYVIAVYLRYDRNYDVYERQVYSVMVMLGDIGGLSQALTYLGLFVVSIFSHRLFVSSVLKEVYQVQRDQSYKSKARAKKFKKKSKTQKVKKSRVFAEDSSMLKLKKTSSNTPSFLNGSSIFRQDTPLKIGFSHAGESHLSQNDKNDYLSLNGSRISNKRPLSGQNKRPVSGQISNRKQKINEEEAQHILVQMVNRERFSYTMKQIFQYLFTCLWCKQKSQLRRNEKLKSHFYYQKGEQKLINELDVVTLLKSIRNLKLLQNTLLSQKQRMLMRFQKKNIIITDSSSADSDSQQFDTLKLMESPSPFVKLLIYGKMKRMIYSYLEENAVGTNDEKLIKGLYIRKMHDFDEDWKERYSNKTLMQRTRQAMGLGDLFQHSERNDSERQDQSQQQSLRTLEKMELPRQSRGRQQMISVSNLNFNQKFEAILNEFDIPERSGPNVSVLENSEKHLDASESRREEPFDLNNMNDAQDMAHLNNDFSTRRK